MSSRSHTALRSTCPSISSTETSPSPFRLLGGFAKRGTQLAELAGREYRGLARRSDEDHPIAFHEHREEAFPVDHVAAVDAPYLAAENRTGQVAALLRGAFRGPPGIGSLGRRSCGRGGPHQFHSRGFPPCSYAYKQLHWCLGTWIGASQRR